jgi:DNA-binding transcriptional MocR family regulator
MPVARKQELVALLEGAGIPLIEDDVYGDLVGEGNVLRPVKRSTRAEM